MSESHSVKRGRGVNQHNSLIQVQDQQSLDQKRRIDDKLATQRRENALDSVFGYDLLREGPKRTGFVFNLRETFYYDQESKLEEAAVECYCVQDDGSTFKAIHIFHPYFLVKLTPESSFTETEEWLGRRFPGILSHFDVVHKEDLDLPNHLSGLKQAYCKLSFRNMQDLMNVRRTILTAVNDNQKRLSMTGAYQGRGDREGANTKRKQQDRILESFLDIREYDVPFTQRVQIDTGLRVGVWFDFAPVVGSASCVFTERKDKVGRPLMKVFAFDIETSKSPLKFPSADVDPIMMISLMLDGKGLLIVNRAIVSADISDFEYSPMPDYPGPFTIINCPSERDMLQAFIDYIRKVKPLIFVTYNGDFFDWPYIDRRARLCGIDLLETIGMWYDEANEEFKGRFSVHLDAFYWVKRDSYLPQGSHGLKAVTKAKLKYDPVELDPEDMLPFAKERPQVLACYSVSDAVATYYLYMKYVHLFIFSLCIIIPMPPGDVLRKGSGTLCEMLLMVQAFENNVVAPNKQMEKHLRYYQGHLLESETYVGGHVACLESGIFRTDIPVHFELNAQRMQTLINGVDDVLRFAIEVEGGTDISTVTNLDEVRSDIVAKLTHLRDNPVGDMPPLIYHLDVGAMYPNIILTNRLQPYAMVTGADCAACDYNAPDAICQRRMEWSWRGKWFLPHQGEVAQLRQSLELNFKPEGARATTFADLREDDQADRLKAAVKTYAQRVYRRLTEERVETREATICQREHSFYVDTVRAFRDRRYDYKALNKTWNNRLRAATDALSVSNAKDMILLYDSMQLAHKCILNSFYGYVMRKGARWCSMPMAGVVTRTGATLIQRAEDLVCDVGKTLELDTDGIWCVLPDCFPENYTVKARAADGSEKKISVSFPCSILNMGVNESFSNHQYHELVDAEKREYRVRSECSIYFEVDGPYRAMVLPASQHEGKNIKKRYAVFNKDGSLAELKGFEIKRRGELKLIKIFQGEVFKTFLEGVDLTDCYRHVGAVADRWLDVLYSKGADLEDEDVFDLISENKSMSETLASYGDARSTSITTARRLGEFLGAEMVKDKGLNCKFVIVRQPEGASVSERAVPVAIFESEPAVKKTYLRKWLRDGSLSNFDIRELLDWDYYITRLSSAIQKIITIPAAFQGVANPVPRVRHPDWLDKALRVKHDKSKQTKIDSFFSKALVKPNLFSQRGADADMEDGGVSNARNGHFASVKRVVRGTAGEAGVGIDDADGEDDMFGLGEAGEPESEEKASEPVAVCDARTDFSGWLRQQKALWRKDRVERLSRRTPAASSASGSASGASSKVHGQWQVLSIRDRGRGYCDVWVLEPRGLVKHEVVVPRVLYLNCRSEELAQQWGRRVDRVLPRGRTAQYLCQLSVSESEFAANKAVLVDLERHPQVEGVYEAGVSSLFNCVLRLGASCVPTDARLSTSSRASWALDELDSLPSDDYLAPLHHVFEAEPGPTNVLYVIGLHAGERHVWLVCGSAAPRGFLLSCGSSSEQLNADALLSSVFHARGEVVALPQITYQSFPSPKELFQGLPRAVLAVRRSTLTPSLLLLQSSLSPAETETHLGPLFSDYPVFRAPALSVQFPSLQWLSAIARTACEVLCQLPAHYSSAVALARACNLPVVNIEPDMYRYALDVLFARSLRESGHLLWSAGGVTGVDVGGVTEDSAMPPPDANIEVQPGCYRSVCVELGVQFLALNALANHAYLEEIECGSSLALVPGGATGTSATGTNAAAATFRILRTMVTRLFPLVHSAHGAAAEALLMHLYRWVCSPHALLHDALLQYAVSRAVHKCFLQLVSQLRELNCTVVAASERSITLATGKLSAPKALAYVEYIIATLRAQPLFCTLTMAPTRIWQALLFLDHSNFAAIEEIPADAEDVLDDADADAEGVDGAGSSAQSPQYVVHSAWALAETLPLASRDAFEKVVARFLDAPFREQRTLLADGSDGAGVLVASSAGSAAGTGADVVQQTTEFTRAFVREGLQRAMLEVLTRFKDIPATVPAADNPRVHVSNPALAAPALPYLAPEHLPAPSHHAVALSFVTAATHVLALDRSASHEVAVAKENLLAKLGVRAFSAEAMLRQNPYPVQVNVCCLRCLAHTNIDLTRVSETPGASAWPCSECGELFAASVVEDRLLQLLQELVGAYQQQDLVCRKCLGVKQLNATQYCTCSALYHNTTDAESAKAHLRVIANVASYHGLRGVADAAEWACGH